MISNNPIASIIIIGYQGKQYLDTCISSVFDQTIPQSDYEVIYADNASHDGSVDYVEKNFPDVRVIKFQGNLGFAKGNNRASEIARGRYLVFLNQDTCAHRQWLSEMLKAMENDPKLGACFSNQIGPACPEYAAIDRIGMVMNVYYPVVSPFGYMDVFILPFKDKPIQTLFLSGGSCMVDRILIDDLGLLFDEDYFMYGEDLDLGFRIYSLGYIVALVPSSILFHDSGSPIHNPNAKNIYNFKAMRKLINILRNRFITFYKNMHTLELILFIPFLFCGAPFKAWGIRSGLLIKIFVVLASFPITLLSSLIAIMSLTKFSKKRTHILSHRKTGKLWLLKAIIKRHPPMPVPISKY